MKGKLANARAVQRVQIANGRISAVRSVPVRFALSFLEDGCLEAVRGRFCAHRASELEFSVCGLISK